jgi:rubrerythrin
MTKIIDIKCQQCGSKAVITVDGKDVNGDEEAFDFDASLKVTYPQDTSLNVGDNVEPTLRNFASIEEAHCSCDNCEDEVFADITFDDGTTTDDPEEAINKILGKTNFNPSSKTNPKVNPKASKTSPTSKQLATALATMNKRIAQAKIKIPKNPQSNQPIPAFSPMMASPTNPNAICSRCGHVFKQNKPILECPQCGLTVGIEVDGEIEWTEEMKEPIPNYVYTAQLPEEIFFKTIQWYYQKWIAKLKGNPSSRLK